MNAGRWEGEWRNLESGIVEVQERWLDGHENEWKSATDQGREEHLKDKTETWDK